MTYLFIIYSVFALVAGYEFFTAPVGYEDKDGFHKEN
jgi:hypothetical protein